ncbi:dynactin subunit 4 isoform X3 [Eurytemora carolleeae]|nr:dynactin subunit 4 isoform X3 [Eurytemora carolleeae]|eukprot:XP_023325806.1 dynactin subunit 4-like isoform X3 [Eurytemora affinis]
MTAKKVYYLACAFCRWTSRDIGLPDQGVASGGWPEQANPYSERVNALQDYYRGIAQKEKMEKESRRFPGRKLSYLQLSDKFGLSSAVSRKRSGLSSLNLGGGIQGREDIGRYVEVTPAEPVSLNEISDLPTELLTEELKLFNVTTLEQRFAQLEFQPETFINIYPTHKHLMIKRSQRCRKCEHNLSKPEYNPTSIKFKIQLAAYYHVPELIIYSLDTLVKDKVSQFVIKVVNPTNSGSVLEFIELSRYKELVEEEARIRQEKIDKGEIEEKPASAINPLRQPSLVEASDQNMDIATAEVMLPKGQIYLPPRDDAAEFDDGAVDLAGHVDNREVVVWRKSNKVGIQLGVKPSMEKVVVGFAIQYQYTNTVFALDSKEIHTATVRIPVFLTLSQPE